jgi:hypothetical protein
MAIKGGDLLTVGNSVLIDRIQNSGPGQVNIPQEKIYELGNYQSVGTVLDIPDLSFPCESIDASAEMESMLLGTTFGSDAAGTEYELASTKVLDVVQQFKPGKTDPSPFDVVGSVAVPYLAVESVSYRFGLRENAGQTVTFKGDSIFYGPAGSSMYVQEAVGTNTANQNVVLTNPCYPNNDDLIGGVRYALSVSLKSGKRLIKGTDYTETVGAGTTTKAITIVVIDAVPATDTIRVTYCSDTVAVYNQASHAADSATRPAAIRGRNIEVFVGGVAVGDRWNGVQSVQADYRVQLQRDEEFGNSNIVGQDYDVPEVSGSVTVKPRDYAELFEKIQTITGAASANESIGALQQTPLSLDIVLYSPTDGSVLKTLYVPDAKFTVPGFSGRVQQKLEVTFSFSSDTGSLSVFKGARP